jgi:hypothetical protein
MTDINFKRLGLIALTLFIVLGFSACKKPTYNKLSEEEMLWLPDDEQDEILLYKSNFSSLTQAMKINYKTRGYRREGEDIYNEFAQIDFIHEGDTSLVHPEDKMGELLLVKNAETFAVFLQWPHFPIQAELTSLPVTSEVIKGRLYNDIRLIDASALANTRFYNSTIWYSKEHGVVQWEDVYGRKFQRLFN